MVNFGSFFVAFSHVERWADAEAEEARLKVLHPGDPEAVAEAMAAWYEQHPAPPVGIGALADHIDHIRKVAGIDHVGLGSDFDGVGELPEGLDDVAAYPALLEELMRRGYSRDDIAKVAGLNLLRVMQEVESVAKDLQTTETPFDVRIEETGGGR